MTTYTRRFWGSRRRTARKYPLYKSVASTAYGNFKAASSGRDQSNVVLQGIMSVPIKVTPSSTASDFRYSAGNGDALGVSIWQALMSTQYFTYYKSMYDQVKLNGFRCKIIGNSASSLTLASGLSSVGTVAAIDRSGIDGYMYTDIEQPASTELAAWTRVIPYLIPTSNNPKAEETGADRVSRLLSYGSAKSKPWSPGNAFTQYISAYARTAQEKQEWISTDKLYLSKLHHNAGSIAGNPKIGVLYGYPSGISNSGLVGEQFHSYDAKYDPYYPTTVRNCAWDPVLLLGVYNVAVGNAEEVAPEQLFSFTVEFKVDVSFRGTRNGGLVKLPSTETASGEKLDSLVQTIPAGTTQSFTPAEGFLWNRATITAGPPTQYGTIGINEEGELLPGTTDIIPTATPNMFILEGDNVMKTVGPFPAAPSFQNLSVRVKGAEYFPPLLLDITRNGTFTAPNSFTGYTLNVNVPSTPTLIELTDIYYDSISVPFTDLSYYESTTIDAPANSIGFFVRVNGPRYLFTVYYFRYASHTSPEISPFYYYNLPNITSPSTSFVIRAGARNVVTADVTIPGEIDVKDFEWFGLFRSCFVINFS